MTQATTTRPFSGIHSTRRLSGLASAPARVLAWIERRRRVAAAVRELSWHSDRDLADMGVHRGEIEAVAEGRVRR